MKYTQQHIELAMILTEELTLSVAKVMELMNCNEETANILMHDLVLAGVAEWNKITGNLDYDPLWR